MDKVSGYNAYQSSYYESRVRDKKEQETSKTTKAEGTKKGKEVQLSRKAQDLLKELKKSTVIWTLLLPITKARKKHPLIFQEVPKSTVF